MTPSIWSKNRISSQPLAIGVGVLGLVLAAWGFDQAWESAGRRRPRVARWLAV